MLNQVRFLIGFLLFYVAFLFQALVLCGPTKAQKAQCNATCATLGAKGKIVTHAIVFFQRRDAQCDCNIVNVQSIHRDGTVVR